MNATMEIEVFRAGDYGLKGRYSADDLRALAGDYDAARHEAPVTLDHRQDGPAFGWVAGLRCVGDVLVARLKDLHESLREWVRTGAYRKRSIELYRAFATTGRPYLRAVSFLGACPPEVKGLADPVFREDAGERVTLEFDEPPQPQHGAEADSSGESAKSTASIMSTASTQSDAPEAAFAEIETLRHEAERLAGELERMRTDRRRAEIERFCDEERRAGRVLPAWEANGLTAFMLSLDEACARIETGDGRRLAPAAWFHEFLQSLRPQIEFGELAMARPTPPFARPMLPRPSDRALLRPETLVLHERALAWCEQHNAATYIEALETVSRL
jgi:hypothetical protein